MAALFRAAKESAKFGKELVAVGIFFVPPKAHGAGGLHRHAPKGPRDFWACKALLAFCGFLAFGNFWSAAFKRRAAFVKGKKPIARPFLGFLAIFGALVLAANKVHEIHFVPAGGMSICSSSLRTSSAAAKTFWLCMRLALKFAFCPPWIDAKFWIPS